MQIRRWASLASRRSCSGRARSRNSTRSRRLGGRIRFCRSAQCRRACRGHRRPRRRQNDSGKPLDVPLDTPDLENLALGSVDRPTTSAAAISSALRKLQLVIGPTSRSFAVGVLQLLHARRYRLSSRARSSEQPGQNWLSPSASVVWGEVDLVNRSASKPKLQTTTSNSCVPGMRLVTFAPQISHPMIAPPRCAAGRPW